MGVKECELVFVCVWVCVCKKGFVCVYVRESMVVCVCVRERERIIVYVCVYVGGGQGVVCARNCLCVCM